MPGSSRYAAFRHRDFRLREVARIAGVVALQIQAVTIAWQVLDATHAPLMLGAVGLAQFLPLILAVPIGGEVADRFDRRLVVATSYFVYGLACAALALTTVFAQSIRPLYAILVVVGGVRAFVGPAASAMLGDVVPGEDLPNAIAWSSSTFQVATIAGPAIGGFLYGHGGPLLAYSTATLLLIGSSALIFAMKPRPPAGTPSSSGRSMFLGIEFVLRHPVLLATSSLDLVAVILAGAVALLPLVADELGGGPFELGALRSAPAIGAAFVGAVLARRPIERRAGLIMIASVIGFGVATVVFGLARSFPLAFFALAMSGAFDMVSVFVRQSIVQRSTPTEVRGRVSAVNLVFISASNELGEMESGVTAAWLGVRPAIVLGGIASILVAGIYGAVSRPLRALSLAREDEDSVMPLPKAPESAEARADESRPS